MSKLSKRRRLMAEKIDASKQYPVGEAVALLSEFASKKFSESFDMALKLGVDVRKSDQVIRGAVSLPHGKGKTVRVAVFAAGDAAAEAEAAGADQVGMEDLVQKVKGGDIDFDVAIATPDAMRLVATLGQILGPIGLMPNPKVGTVTPEVGKAVTNAKSGQMYYRVDRGGIVHGSIGQVGFSPEAIKENIEAVLTEIVKAKPATAKGIYLQQLTLSTSMGPGLVVNQSSLQL